MAKKNKETDYYSIDVWRYLKHPFFLISVYIVLVITATVYGTINQVFHPLGLDMNWYSFIPNLMVIAFMLPLGPILYEFVSTNSVLSILFLLNHLYIIGGSLFVALYKKRNIWPKIVFALVLADMLFSFNGCLIILS